jgi:hypothetical protein
MEEDQKSRRLINLEKSAVDAFINKNYSDDASSCPDDEPSARMSKVSAGP